MSDLIEFFTSKMTSMYDPNAKCIKCKTTVFYAEERAAGGNKWHEKCFKCEDCRKVLDSTNCAEYGKDKLYCQNCYSRKFGPKGYGFCQTMENNKNPAPFQKPRRMSIAPMGEGCPRCGGNVYAAERMLARGRGYHVRCFKCLECNRTLDSTIHCDGPDKDIYCKVCYAIKFGSRGYGHAGVSSIGLTSDAKDTEWQCEIHAPKSTEVKTTTIKAPEGTGCPRCGGAVFAAEKVLSKGREWHRKCFHCHECTKTLDSRNTCDGPDKEVYCQTCYGRKWGPHGYGFSGGNGFLQTNEQTDEEIMKDRSLISSTDTTLIKAKPDGKGCPRCGGAVFAAEQMLAKGTLWHMKCYKCKECNRSLNSTNASDGPNNEVFCQGCYGKTFGPVGVGYGHTLSSNAESHIKPTVTKISGVKLTNGSGCPRCGFVVYAAEQWISKNKPWHKRCFNCAGCHRSLDSTNLNDASDGEIYCRNCYARSFGPQGVGFGKGGGVLTVG